VVREEVRLGLAFYRAEGEVERTAEAVAWELDRPAINGGGGRLGAAVTGGEEVRWRCGSAAAPFMAQWRRRTGAGRPGTAPGCGGRRGEERGGARPEIGDGPDRWAPPVGGCEGERRSRAGRRINGPRTFRGPL
jgi:hypothetical protein